MTRYRDPTFSSASQHLHNQQYNRGASTTSATTANMSTSSSYHRKAAVVVPGAGSFSRHQQSFDNSNFYDDRSPGGSTNTTGVEIMSPHRRALSASPGRRRPAQQQQQRRLHGYEVGTYSSEAKQADENFNLEVSAALSNIPVSSSSSPQRKRAEDSLLPPCDVSAIHGDDQRPAPLQQRRENASSSVVKPHVSNLHDLYASAKFSVVTETEKMQGTFGANRSHATPFNRASRFGPAEKKEKARRTTPGPGSYNTTFSSFTPRGTGTFGRTSRPELFKSKEIATRPYLKPAAEQSRHKDLANESRAIWNTKVATQAANKSAQNYSRNSTNVSTATTVSSRMRGNAREPDTAYERSSTLRPETKGGVISRTGRPSFFKKTEKATPGPGQYVPLYGNFY